MHTSQRLNEAGMGVLLKIPSGAGAKTAGPEAPSKPREGRSFDQSLAEARRELNQQDRTERGVRPPARAEARPEASDSRVNRPATNTPKDRPQASSSERERGVESGDEQRQESAASTPAASSPAATNEPSATADTAGEPGAGVIAADATALAEDPNTEFALIEPEMPTSSEDALEQPEALSLAEAVDSLVAQPTGEEPAPNTLTPEEDAADAQVLEPEASALSALAASLTQGAAKPSGTGTTLGGSSRAAVQQSSVKQSLVGSSLASSSLANAKGAPLTAELAAGEGELLEGEMLEGETKFEMPTKADLARVLAGEGTKPGARDSTSSQVSTPQPTAGLSTIKAAEPLLSAARTFVPQSVVATPVGQPQWSQAVGDKVLWLASQNLAAAELRLDPPDLGPMQVRVSVQNDQVQVTFTSPHASVREALDQSANRLREMFNEQGLNLNMDVSDQSLARHQSREDSQSSGNGGQAEADTDEQVLQETPIQQLRLVDHYA